MPWPFIAQIGDRPDQHLPAGTDRRLPAIRYAEAKAMRPDQRR